jgi:N-acetylmuramoyl-L-alanine amidase
MDQIKIGKFIADCRKKANYTQLQLSEKLGITDRAISKWETGKSLPDSSIMLELCGLLGITVNDLLSGEVVKMNDYTEQLENTLLEVIKEKEQADSAAAQNRGIIFIDPGHGGMDSGSDDDHDRYEKDDTLRLSLAVRDHLQALGFNVAMSRTEDEMVDRTERGKMANKAGAQLFVSIHRNKADGDGHGVEVVLDHQRDALLRGQVAQLAHGLDQHRVLLVPVVVFFAGGHVAAVDADVLRAEEFTVVDDRPDRPDL